MIVLIDIAVTVVVGVHLPGRAVLAPKVGLDVNVETDLTDLPRRLDRCLQLLTGRGPGRHLGTQHDLARRDPRLLEIGEVDRPRPRRVQRPPQVVANSGQSRTPRPSPVSGSHGGGGIDGAGKVDAAAAGSAPNTPTPRSLHPSWVAHMQLTANVGSMSKTIQVRDVPDDVHAELRSRAAAAGSSLSDYVLDELRRAARRSANAELLIRSATRSWAISDISAADLVDEARNTRS